MAILTICCLWIVTDVAYGVRMWELGVDAWIGRIKALAIILIGVSLSLSLIHISEPTRP